MRPRWPLCREARLSPEHNTPNPIPFYEYLRIACERADDRERVEGWKEDLRVPPAPLGAFRPRTTTRRHPGLFYDDSVHYGGLSYRRIRRRRDIYCGRRQWVAGKDTMLLPDLSRRLSGHLGSGNSYNTDAAPHPEEGVPLRRMCTWILTQYAVLGLLSEVSKGTAAPWDQGPRIIVQKGTFFPSWFWPFCIIVL